MDKNRHLIEDQGFDVFERASFGKGCEIQPFIHDHSHGQKCECIINNISINRRNSIEN